ncbi:CHAT domain-containing protein [Ephemerocybe angulata]|uniref:CHAT domain-containing protein n=1 Tax=Ephemerocybe angulata TaxID=980116 RepID=A0A8H6HE82_9AGAR|nr:CHAT domain-containing protein [Tulosesus angulatus]
MGQQNSLTTDTDIRGESQICMTDIVVERTDEIGGHKPSLNLTELWVFGIPELPEGKCFPLTNASSTRWEVSDFISISSDVKGIDCIVKSKEGGDEGYLHLNVARMITSNIKQDNRLSENMGVCDSGMELTLSSEVLVMSSEEPGGDESIASQFSILGDALQTRFENTGSLSDIDEAITANRNALALIPDGSASQPSALFSLGTTLSMRFDLTGDVRDNAEAITLARRAAELDPNHYSALNLLGISLSSRFVRVGELSDIHEAILVLQNVVDHTPQEDSRLYSFLNTLAASLSERFQRTGELSDISESIRVQQRAVSLIPSNHPHLHNLLKNLGGFLALRYQRTGELSDISESIVSQRKAVELTPQDHPALSAHLKHLGATFGIRFSRTGDLGDITEAITMQQRAIELTPHYHPDLPSRLDDLGNTFYFRFSQTGDISEAAEAISLKQRAIQLTPKDDAKLPMRLSNLGNVFQGRFTFTRDPSDMAEAMSLKQRVVDLTPPNHRELPARLSTLGNSFVIHHKSSGKLSDADKAVSLHQRAADLTPQDHAELPDLLQNLACSLIYRFQQTGNISDLNTTVPVLRRAIELAPPRHPHRHSFFLTLANAFIMRFEKTGDISDVSESISAARETLEIVPPGHVDVPSSLRTLGRGLRCRFDLTFDKEDLDASISQYKAAAISTSGSLEIRLQAAQAWASLLTHQYPQSPEILLSFDTALGLLALFAGLDRTVRGRYSQLQNTSDIALKAAAAACSLGREDKALEWLEQGRCLVWSQLNNLRTPLDDLQACDATLARRISEVSSRLEVAGTSRDSSNIEMPLSQKISIEAEARAHMELAREWDDLLQTTRAIPGFESFLKPLSCSTLMANLPEEGPIVVINIDKSRCDAIALLAGLGEPLPIPLPNFSVEKANVYRADLKSQLQSRLLRARGPLDGAGSGGESLPRGMRSAEIGPHEDHPVHGVLQGLWEDVVKPILNALGISKVTEASGETRPRIWWCPTGPSSFLPLHAAGIYRGTDPESVLDYVVSSYTPTVTAITDRVKNRRSIDTQVSGLFLTNQPCAPDAPPINGTTKEVQSIFKRAEESGVRVLKLEGGNMSIDQCLENMQGYSSIHLACHAAQNAAEPLQSRFLFHNGSLELATILKTNLKNADLAFLSACQTSTGDEKISDEAVHLAAGMLAAGYRRVVATMWSIGDTPAQEVATDFYDFIIARRKGGSGTAFDGALSAHALHHATQRLRGRLGDFEHSLLAWIPFVHFGY